MTTRKPRPLKLDNVTARAIRGPHQDGSGRWYWRADLYVAGERRRETLWTGWASREEVRQEVSRLMAQRSPVDAAQAEREARRGEVQTVRDLLEVYFGQEQTRVALWRQEEQAGEAAVARGAAKKVQHSKDALAPRSYSGKHSAGKQVARSLGGVRLRDLKNDDLRRYVAARLADAAGGTVRNEVRALSAAWRWGAREGRTYTEGLRLRWPQVLATPVREKYTPTRAEVRRVLARMPEGWERDILTCQSLLGCRIRALARLPRSDVDLASGTVRLKCKDHDRTVRVPDDVLDVLRPYVQAATEHGTIWPVTESTAVEVCKVRKANKNNLFADACLAAGVTRFTSHGLRRLVSNEWIARGVNVAVYARVLGHSPEEALRAYAAIQGDDEIAAFAKAAELQDADNVTTMDRRRA